MGRHARVLFAFLFSLQRTLFPQPESERRGREMSVSVCMCEDVLEEKHTQPDLLIRFISMGFPLSCFFPAYAPALLALALAHGGQRDAAQRPSPPPPPPAAARLLAYRSLLCSCDARR